MPLYDLFDAYGLGDEPPLRTAARGVRMFGDKLPQGSLAQRGVGRLADVFDVDIPQLGEFAESLSPLGMAETGLDLLLRPGQPAKPAPKIAVPPNAGPSGLAATPKNSPGLDMDSVPGEETALSPVAAGQRRLSLKEPGTGYIDSPIGAPKGPGALPQSLRDSAVKSLAPRLTALDYKQDMAKRQLEAGEEEFERTRQDPFWRERALADIEMEKLGAQQFGQFQAKAGLQEHEHALKQRAAQGLQQKIQALDTEEASASEDLRALQSHPDYLALQQKAASDPAAAQRLKAAEDIHKTRIAQAQLQKKSLLQSYGMATGETPSALFAQNPPAPQF
jgi:hypothetical protein